MLSSTILPIMHRWKELPAVCLQIQISFITFASLHWHQQNVSMRTSLNNVFLWLDLHSLGTAARRLRPICSALNKWRRGIREVTWLITRYGAPEQQYLFQDAGRISKKYVFGNLTFTDCITRAMKAPLINATRLRLWFLGCNCLRSAGGERRAQSSEYGQTSFIANNLYFSVCDHIRTVLCFLHSGRNKNLWLRLVVILEIHEFHLSHSHEGLSNQGNCR